MLQFNNQGHRQALLQLGILLPYEYEISAADLAWRLCISVHSEQGLYIIKQELSHHLQKHLILEMHMDIMKELVDSIHDMETLLAAITAFYELAEIIWQANQESKNMRDFLKALEQNFLVQMPPALTTPLAREHLDGLAILVRDVLQQSHSIRNTMKREFEILCNIIQQKGHQLET